MTTAGFVDEGVPAPRVCVLLNEAAAGASGYFTVGSSVVGGPDVIAGDVPIDVLTDLDGLSFRVGRSLVTDPFEAVEGQVQLKNFDRRWDPESPLSQWPGQARPNRRLFVEVADVRIFTGHIETWDYAFDPVTGDDTVTI